ncbi:hypothetical protein BDQ12DRAFT_90507 [Crucibulum laeve]|uniref:Uncharacterized protein n=1 Tax=Crucibulum laeve TaxID=68775 RepID=A0A5C3M3Y0_9AGAR|nr:hypothetical protein BDQ12DRAFT_90507 [Crucibulum laeve]
MENNLPEDSRVVREQQIDRNRRIQKVDLLPIEMEGSASENSKVAKERRSDIQIEPKLPPSRLAEIIPTPNAAHSLESRVIESRELVMQTQLDRRMVALTCPLNSSPMENDRRNSLEVAPLVGNSENTSRAKLETALVAGSIPEYPPPPYPGS